jgi:hypothetical protein
MNPACETSGFILSFLFSFFFFPARGARGGGGLCEAKVWRPWLRSN